MTNNRTIIDILRKGNQELFHSSMIAWLLDPQAEHGIGDVFLKGFGDLLAERGSGSMLAALRTAPPTSIETEATSYKRRYDIVLHVGQTTVVIENKTKSLGGTPQFDKYKDKGTVLVALGLTDISFDRKVQADYPVVTYGDLLRLLDAIDPPGGDYGVLVRHYRDFLRRELGLLDDVAEWAATASPEVAERMRHTVQTTTGITTNDRRFLNWCFLERFVEKLKEKREWQSCRFQTDKNMQSGVWLALFNPSAPPNPYRFDQGVEEFCSQNSAGLWFHIELWSGLLAESDGDTAGVLQLKCHSDQKSNNAAIRDAFQAMWQLEEGESFVKAVKNDADTFYLLGRSLSRSQLTYDGLEEQLESFMRRLGEFGEVT